jgi:hypothetical protein
MVVVSLQMMLYGKRMILTRFPTVQAVILNIDISQISSAGEHVALQR